MANGHSRADLQSLTRSYPFRSREAESGTPDRGLNMEPLVAMPNSGTAKCLWPASRAVNTFEKKNPGLWAREWKEDKQSSSLAYSRISQWFPSDRLSLMENGIKAQTSFWTGKFDPVSFHFEHAPEKVLV